MDEPKSNGQLIPEARWELRSDELAIALDPVQLGFRTTDDLQPLDKVVGQERALRALEFGVAIRQRGYNMVVSGVSGTGKRHLIQQVLEAHARRAKTPDDWVYVYNFDEPGRPHAFRLPAGHGVRLRTDLQQFIEHLRQDLSKGLKAKDFDAERERLSKIYGERSDALYNELLEHASRLDSGVHRLANGMLGFTALKDGKPMEAEEVERLSDEERQKIEKRHQELGEHLEAIISSQQHLAEQLREEVKKTLRAFAQRLVTPLIARIKSDYPQVEVVAWLDQLGEHVLNNLARFQEEPRESNNDLPGALRAAMEREDRWLEYRVNVVADNARSQGAPIISEISPTYKNLFGTIEHDVNLFGRVTMDFTGIRPGSILRANGGYLVIDLEDALTEPLVWKQLKRTLKSGQLLTDVYEPLPLLATTALKPEPIPLDTKVVAIGSPDVFFFLQYVDGEFRELFKIHADFGPETSRNAAGHEAYARFVARLARAEGLPPFDAAAVAEIIRFGAREAGQRDKLSVELGNVADLVREAAHWARSAGANIVTAAHVRQTLDERVFRSDRIAAKIRELIDEGTLRISIAGKKVGQVNGLAVLDLGDQRFGRPSRVTASVGVGQEGLINVERESELSGSTHDKGVLILEGYLRNRYARRHPLSLSASVAFEQSYGWIEGDSASSAELYCLLSAIADVPLRQNIAVTGSVNQHGEIQAVGGVNEKVEGFFDICRTKGLTGDQGVCLPRSNLRHLMLRPDVIDAVREGHFHVWAIDSIDEGIELLTGMPAGDLDQEATFHHRLDQRLQQMLAVLQDQPGPGVVLRQRSAVTAAPQPTLPPLPGERG